MADTVTRQGGVVGRLILVLGLTMLAAGIFNVAKAQRAQPTAEQMRIINQLPPAQRRQALDAIRQMQGSAGQRPNAQNEAPDDQEQDSSGQGRIANPELVDGQFLASGGSSLVVTMHPKPDLADDELAQMGKDPVLRPLSGSNYFELDDSGVLHLPGLQPIALLGLNEEGIATRLGAEQSLRQFDISVTVLDSETVGEISLDRFGHGLFEGAVDLGAAAVTGPVPLDYLLGPGDGVVVQLYGNVSGTHELTISRDGFLNLPEMGPLNAAGLSFSELRDAVRQRVSSMLIGTNVSITMGGLRTIRIFVVGDVLSPGSYAVSSLSTVSSALYRSGGISEVGSLRDVQLKRQGATIATLDVYDLLLRGDTSGDLPLRQGDVVLVPPAGPSIGVSGAVKRPGIYEVRAGETLDDVIAMAGGLAADAAPLHSTLERVTDEGERVVLNVSFGAQDRTNIDVRDGDLLRVPRAIENRERAVTVRGHVYRPGPREWQRGMRLSDLIGSLDQLKSGADSEYVLIRREKGSGLGLQVLSANLEAALEAPGSADDLELKQRDIVYVFDLQFGRQRIISPLLDELKLYARIGEPYREVEVSGAVRAPGAYPLEVGMRLSDLVRAGGSLSEGAFVDRAELTRYEIVDGELRHKTLLEVDLRAVLSGEIGADIELRAYDHLRVSRVPDWQSDWSVTLEGEVRFPGEYQIRRGELLSSVIRRAGGLTAHAFPEGAIFLREELKQREKEQIDTLARRVESDLASMSLASLDTNGSEAFDIGQSLLNQLRETEPVGRLVIDLPMIVENTNEQNFISRIELKDGDRLLVPGRAQEVTVIGEAQYPTSHLYREGLSRQDYISASGGVTRKADEKLIYVVRANGSVMTSGRSRWFGRSSGIDILPGDTIVIPVETDRIRPLTFWTNVSQIFYQTAIAIAAVRTFDN